MYSHGLKSKCLGFLISNRLHGEHEVRAKGRTASGERFYPLQSHMKHPYSMAGYFTSWWQECLCSQVQVSLPGQLLDKPPKLQLCDFLFVSSNFTQGQLYVCVCMCKYTYIYTYTHIK